MKTIDKINYIAELVKAGGTLEQYSTTSDRGKVMGRMWRGSARVKYNEIFFFFSLWHHGSNNETDESLEKFFKLEGIGTQDDRYTDASWSAIPAKDGIYMHNRGWFRDRNLANHAIIKMLPNRNIWSVALTPGEKAVLESLGFRRVFAINPK